MKMAHKKSVRPLEIKYLSSFLIKFNRILRQIIFDLAIIPIKCRCEWGNFSSVIFQTEAEIKKTVFISLFFDIGLAMLNAHIWLNALLSKQKKLIFFLLLQFYDQTDRNVHIPKSKSWISTLIQSRHSQKSHRIIILLYFIGSANSARASSFSYGNPVIIDFVSFCRYIFPFLRLYMLNALNVPIFDCVLSPSTLSCITPVPPCMVFPFVVNLK